MKIRIVEGKILQKFKETGNYYYGARYYDPTISIWLSVDPLKRNNLHLTPYNFVSNNPIMRIDPDGMDDGWYKDEEGIHYDENINSEQDMKDKNIKGKFLGLTYQNAGSYYSLFGEQYSANSFEGKVAQKIDESLIKYGEYLLDLKNQDPNSWSTEWDDGVVKKSTDLNGLIKYKENFLGADRRANVKKSTYLCATVYTQVFKSERANRGYYVFSDNKPDGNKNYSQPTSSLVPGYNSYIKNSTGGSNMIIVFPDLATKINMRRKFNLIFR